MKTYNTIEQLATDQTHNFDAWSNNEEDFYDDCPYDCFNNQVGDSEKEDQYVFVTGGKLKVLTWEQLVKPLDIWEIIDNRYWDLVGDEDSVFEYFPREKMENWGSEFEEMVLNKFKELDLSNVYQQVTNMETFKVRINKEDLE